LADGSSAGRLEKQEILSLLEQGVSVREMARRKLTTKSAVDFLKFTDPDFKAACAKIFEKRSGKQASRRKKPSAASHKLSALVQVEAKRAGSDEERWAIHYREHGQFVGACEFVNWRVEDTMKRATPGSPIFDPKFHELYMECEFAYRIKLRDKLRQQAIDGGNPSLLAFLAKNDLGMGDKISIEVQSFFALTPQAREAGLDLARDILTPMAAGLGSQSYAS
jgi:hypothetical protein